MVCAGGLVMGEDDTLFILESIEICRELCLSDVFQLGEELGEEPT